VWAAKTPPDFKVNKIGRSCVTFLSNIRITTFFAGESEVRIVDPSGIPEVQGFGAIRPIMIFDISC